MSKIILFILFIFSLYTQNLYTISGFVKDKSNKESLIGVSVYLKGTNHGTSTNTDGYYVITDIPAGKYSLIVYSVGYQKIEEEIEFNEDGDLKKNIYLTDDLYRSEMVEVVAEQQRKKIDLMFTSPISEIQLSNKILKQIPQVAEADLMRSLQTLPGVMSVSDFSSALFIRGGTSDQNLYLIDGADVYNPEHAFGVFSTFNTDAIKIAELTKGGFSAEYGGRLSSVLNVINLDGNREKFEGTASLSILAAKTTLQFPLGEKRSVSGSFRRTYFDQVLPDDIEQIPDYHFWDGNIKAFYDLDDKNNISFSFFSGKDDFNLIFNKKAVQNNEKEEGIHYDWGNQTASLKWTHIFTPTVFSNSWVNYSMYDSFLKEFNLMNENNTIRDLTLKSILQYEFSKKFQFKFGFEYKKLSGSFKQESSEYLLDIPFENNLTMGFASAIWKPSEKLFVETGLRANHFELTGRGVDYAPRFSAKYKLTKTSNLKFSAGKFFQYLHQTPRFFIANVWIIANKYQSPSSSSHAILGYQKTFNDGLYDLELEAYYKKYDDIYSFNRFTYQAKPSSHTGNGIPEYSTTQDLFNRGDGNSKGLELTLRKNTGNVSGWLAYTYSRTQYKFDGINKEKFFSPRHDRSHLINLVLNINYSRWLNGAKWKPTDSEWTFGVNFIYGSGQAITVPSSMYFRNVNPGDKDVQWHSLYPTTLGEFRMPAYMRMDISINYKAKYEKMTVEPYLQIFNVGNRSNVWYMDYKTKVEGGKVIPKIEKKSMFPLLPTLGVNFTF